MTSAAQFKENVKHTGLTAKLKSPGRIIFVISALEAYEQAKLQRMPPIQQVSYLYELYKQCKKWLAEKNDATSDKSKSRWLYVRALQLEVSAELGARFPEVSNGLNAFEQTKQKPFQGQTQAAQGVYAHETAIYRSNKMEGKYSNPGSHRVTASATLLDQNKLDVMRGTDHPDHKAYKNSSLWPVRNGLTHENLTEPQFRELDKICRGQFNVLYLSKIRRLQYMVIIQGGLMTRPDGSLITLLPGGTLDDELDSGGYAIDKYGNLFITRKIDHAGQQINHTTLCAGNEVLCAGTMSIKQGKLRVVTNGSGHYQPTTAHLLQALDMLQQSGVDLMGVVVCDYTQQPSGKAWANEFMKRSDKQIPPDIYKRHMAKTA